MISLIAPVFVSAGTINAGITPDSYWYLFDKAIDKVEIVFTFGSEKKVKKILEKAEERLAEAQALAEDKKFEDVDSLLKDYGEGIINAGEKTEKIKDGEKSSLVLSTIEETTLKHQEVLNDILKSVPEEIKEKIQKIIDEVVTAQNALESKLNVLQKENEELKKEIETLKQETQEIIKADTVPVVIKTPVVDRGIKLYVEAYGSDVKLSWQVSGVDVSKGFKLLEGYSEDLTYPGNSATYLDASKTYYKKQSVGGKVMYYRICAYTGNGCGAYSNTVKIWIPETSVKEIPVQTGEVKSVTLYSADGRVKWITDGYSEQGFKVVWSLNSEPTYPTRSEDKYLYFSDPVIKTTTLEPFAGSGKYYVRVCEYLGGKCGIYSNQVEIQL
ncbi:hypothetical protein A3I18_00230 [Candidatus Campbellbacteria bacterium RIFCSPLOWO2_02_FULL_35_11]|uniref:DUF5667 domain-containing protein n=2 Tax=Candidatus Campbelliibacteriota TaxID=1752727 RepID=A0A1F5EP53_9BACT|nr:MAG: hypothetical protein A3E89_01185 [Candidatus Campbellbacteria bacterium RIFCSPHIGHO2_12_FULL_35_10]OGD70065.1 MAG: hypothetical protein A3I18_00230 [Candidatus Campbellbacteria bacterium RIFCSPLOWO2_02_FULL_35_11]